jgi:deoxyhypusine synthase
MFNYFITPAESTSAGGCMQIYADMIKYNMVDAIVSTGLSIVADIGKKEKEEIS